MTKKEIVGILEEIAVLLEIKGENPFKVRAYQNGARALETVEDKVADLIESDRLDKIRGVGDALAKKIVTLHETGSLEYHDSLKASVPPGLLEMLEIPGLGGKKVKAIYGKLGVTSIEELTAACEAGKVADLPGFGPKSQTRILEGIHNREVYGKRHLWWHAREVAEPILEGLRGLPEVERAEHAGSLRRSRETVGDLDFIVASDEPQPVMDWFTGQGWVGEVTAKGETKSSVRMESGLQVDLRVVPSNQFAFALHHFTGSKEHNVSMRQRALGRGYSLSEWGLTEVEEGPRDPEAVSPIREGSPCDPAEIRTEEALFDFLGMEYVPPELREDMGEIESAESDGLPELIRPGDLRGAFHNHTTASDGSSTMAEMAEAADALGWEYLGIADHSKASFQANGLDEARLEKQITTIREFNESGQANARLFAGVECDILPDGRLDLAESVLEQLDYVVVSIHSSFTQSTDVVTQRMIRAIEHPCTTMVGHLTGRILLQREGYAVDVLRVIDAAAANGVIIELNANPYRLDMDWRYWRRAVGKGVLCSINPDAHEAVHLSFVDAGVRIARKGWLTAGQVLNTWPLDRVEGYLAGRGR
ncbi:MAG: DNA polymerase/3'-5' exonuclease PolX [Verrucomicrobia bacterium]|nr:MAG: DNA polymerase/3'-5' exonuclease PolX [Verrucomicrobiota bacterium]